MVVLQMELLEQVQVEQVVLEFLIQLVCQCLKHLLWWLQIHLNLQQYLLVLLVFQLQSVRAVHQHHLLILMEILVMHHHFLQYPLLVVVMVEEDQVQVIQLELQEDQEVELGVVMVVLVVEQVILHL